jgi:hypothetical protein
MSTNNDIRMKPGHFALAASLSLVSCAHEETPPQSVQSCSFRAKTPSMTRGQKDQIANLIIEQEELRDQIDKQPQDIQENVFREIEAACAEKSMSCINEIKARRRELTSGPEFDECKRMLPKLRTECEDAKMPRSDPEGTITFLEISNECGRKYLDCVNRNTPDYESRI